MGAESRGSVAKPVAPPVRIDGVYSPEQEERILACIRENGPWRQILNEYVANADQLAAITSGEAGEGGLDEVLAPTFHGVLANDGVCFYRELEDVFLSPRLLDHARSYWKAQHAVATRLFLNINGPTSTNDPGHVDSAHFRGVGRHNTPLWMLTLMGKSGLFQQWMIKMAQVVTWWYRGGCGGGFTYWPDGPSAPAKCITPPMWNTGILVQNEMMYHRAESNGPAEQRRVPGLSLDSELIPDPDGGEGWVIRDDGRLLARIPAEEIRIMLHWNAEIYFDHADLKRHRDHSDDLTRDRVFEIFVDDLRSRGIELETPTDPEHDSDFVSLLLATYDPGSPQAHAPM